MGVLLAGLAAQAGQFPGLNEVIEVLAPCQHRLFDLGGELAMPGLSGAQCSRNRAPGGGDRCVE
ncbi:cob(I)alamin adenosyltransferase [Pseudomonas baetica]|nr:cob(I)alamin adenosyltransferase [Pseudomonas baetica]